MYYSFAEIQTRLLPNGCHRYPVHIPPPDYDFSGNLDLSPELANKDQLQVHHHLSAASRSNSSLHENKHRRGKTLTQKGKNKIIQVNLE